MSENNNNEIVVQPQHTQQHSMSVYNDSTSFENAQRVAKALAASTMVPKDYQNNVPNVLVALEMSNRIGASPLMVMQNLNVIHGRPSWGSSFIIATLQSCGRFGPLRYKVAGEGDKKTCFAYATDKDTNEVVEGPPVSIEMAKKEGWYTKTGSKWPNMPDLMLRYRAAAFFGRLYAPEIMMGMHTDDEVNDFAQPTRVNRAAEALNETIPPVQHVEILPPDEDPLL